MNMNNRVLKFRVPASEIAKGLGPEDTRVIQADLEESGDLVLTAWSASFAPHDHAKGPVPERPHPSAPPETETETAPGA